MNKSVKKYRKKRHLSKPVKIVLISAASLLLILVSLSIFLFATKPGRKILYQYAANQIYIALDNQLENGHPQRQLRPKKVNFSNHIEGTRNYLIFGLEEIKGAKNTDTIMIVTLNLDTGTIKLTSLMRDTIVEIPDYGNHKLNSAYAFGELDSLLDTIEKNYLIDIDGYASVNFDSFEEIVDILGGVDIELTEEEASYLNTTNYISNPAYRNVHPGWNQLNGNQALGYCRIRKRKTINGSHDDYGRTERQRIVLNALFQKYKSKNIFDLINIALECLGFIETDVTEKEISDILEALVENHNPKLETFRLPADNAFSEEVLAPPDGASLVLDWKENIKQFYMFLYEETEEKALERFNNAVYTP